MRLARLIDASIPSRVNGFWSRRGQSRGTRSRRICMSRSKRGRDHGPSIALGPTNPLSIKRLETPRSEGLGSVSQRRLLGFHLYVLVRRTASSGEISPRVATPERQQPPAPRAASTHRALARSSRTRIGRGRLETDNAFALRNLGGHRGRTLRLFGRCVHTSHRWEHGSLSRSAAGCWSAADGHRRRDGTRSEDGSSPSDRSSARAVIVQARLRGAHFAAVHCSRETVQLQADSASCSLLRPMRLDF